MKDAEGTEIKFGDRVVFRPYAHSSRLAKGHIFRLSKCNVWVKESEDDKYGHQRSPNRVIIIPED